jgi:plastocyanin
MMRVQRKFALSWLLALVAAIYLPAAAAQTVTMTDSLKFQPSQIEVPVGTTVTWNNTSSVVHTVTADPSKANDPAHVKLPEGAETFDSGMIQPGGSFSHTFETPGEYRYFCIPHEGVGMIGTVTVTE